jgi:hypothetical protein
VGATRVPKSCLQLGLTSSSTGTMAQQPEYLVLERTSIRYGMNIGGATARMLFFAKPTENELYPRDDRAILASNVNFLPFVLLYYT